MNENWSSGNVFRATTERLFYTQVCIPYKYNKRTRIRTRDNFNYQRARAPITSPHATYTGHFLKHEEAKVTRLPRRLPVGAFPRLAVARNP